MSPKKKPRVVKEYGPDLYRILPPILNRAILELLKNGKRTHVQHPCDRNITVVYLLPRQPMACADCGLLSTNFASFEKHKCTKGPSTSVKKYVSEDIRMMAQATDPPHFFTYLWGESCLLHRDGYNYACICGAVFDGKNKLRNLERHFHLNPCDILKSLFAPTGTIVPTQDFTPAFNTGKINVFKIENKVVRTSTVLDFAFPGFDLASECRAIQIVLANNFSKIQAIVSAGHDYTTNGCHTIEEFGAVSIQSDRLEICVRPENRSNGRGIGCWNFLCAQFGFKKQIMKCIIDNAIHLAARKTKGKFKYDTISIIVTKSTNDQHPHIDIGHPLVQHGMMLSDGDTSTIAYKVTEFPSVKTNKHILQLFRNLSDFSRVPTEYPSEAFLKKIDAMLTEHSNFRRKFIQAGWFRLFQVCIPGHYETHSLINAAAGTLTTIKGGVVHKGSGAIKGGVRSVLFFTGSPKNSSESYDSDVQHTAITVFIQFCSRICFLPIDTATFAQIIETLLILLNQCHETYRRSVPTFFRSDDGKKIKLHQLLMELSRHKQGAYTQQYIDKIANKYIQLGNLFPEDEVV